MAQWQSRAWEAHRTVGELRSGVRWLANALSKVNLIPAKPPAAAGDEPQPLELVDDEGNPGADAALAAAAQLVTDIAGGPVGQGQLLASSTIHMMLPGICYVLATVDEATDSFSSWCVLSQTEVRAKGSDTGSVRPQQGEVAYERQVDEGRWEDIPDGDVLIKVWRQDPEKSWEPDSPVRSVLDVLDEIRLCTDHIKATAESRLTGAGLLVFPSEVEFPAAPQRPVVEGEPAPEPPTPLDGFVDTLIEVAEVSIADRSSAAARVPLPITVPGEWADKVRHVTFATPFDQMVLDVRAAGIVRLSYGMELPPEVLTGLGDTNHWSGRQIEESAITVAVEPMAEILCHALTVGYLKPALQAMGLRGDELIVWRDTSDLRARPDRTQAAQHAYDQRGLSLAALLRETGLSEEDMPDEDERDRRILEAIALGNGQLAPQAMRLLGFDVEDPAPAVAPTPPLVDEEAPEPDPTDEALPPADGPPERQPAPPPDDTQAAALLAACDGLVMRALERAGARLKSFAGRKTPGGAAAVDCKDSTLLHTQLDATSHAPLDSLMAGAWSRVSEIARRYDREPAELQHALDAYTRALIAAGHAHDLDRLSAALGLHATV